MKSLDPDTLAAACGDLAIDAGISIHTRLEPIAGAHAPVKPAIYMGPAYQEDWRWWGDPPQKTRALVIDNVPSQANRLEAALSLLRGRLGLPEVALDLSTEATLPSHLPRRLSGFSFPHRQADAYLRDATLDGKAFSETPLGEKIVNATAERPQVLYGWFPQALLFGYWQSHLGKKRTQAKLARSWVSEIVGYDPAAGDHLTRARGLKGDPLNLSITEPIVYNEDDQLRGWSLDGGSQRAKGGSKQKDSLAEIGHGQVPISPQDASLAGVSFRAIEQHTSVSFAGLRRIHAADAADGAAGRAMLVALGLVAHVTAFGRGFSLRSGCDLRPVSTAWAWISGTEEEPIDPPGVEEAISLFQGCLSRAEAAGVVSDGGWHREPLILGVNDALAQAIRASWPLED